MLESVDVGKRSVADYEATAGREAEILRSEVPLLRDLGLAADWKIITDDTGFFAVTKTMHNALQGARRSLTDHEKEIYLTYSTRNAHLLDEEYDLIVAHDPQPLAVPHFHGRGGTRWVWRCHIDTSEPNENLWGFLRPYLDDYDAAVFTEKSFVPPVFPVPRVEIYRQIRDAASRDPDVDTFTNLTGVGNVEVNAFQRFSDVCVQKSIREGFGLVVSETLWKGTPMVAGEAGGIPMQMPGGTGGFLVGSVEECAEKLLFLLRNPEEGKELARSGKETIRKRFLLTRLISDELELYADLIGATAGHGARSHGGGR